MLNAKPTSRWIAAAILCALCSAPPVGAAVKDQSRIPSDLPRVGDDTSKPPDIPGTILDPPPDIPDRPDEDDTKAPQHYDINDIPALVRIDLTVDIAKRALDAFAEIGTKYDDQGLSDYPTLEEFVAKTQAGKKLQADVIRHGFKTVGEWNTAIMNVSFSFTGLLHDQSTDIRHQIEAVQADKKLDEAKKRRIIASLNALIPTRHNMEIIKELQKLPIYQEKLNLLDAFE